MKNFPIVATFVSVVGLAACARLDFGEGGLTYYDPVPYFFVSTSADCISTGSAVAIPGTKRALHFKTGYGATELSATLSNGLIASVGQKTDTQIPQTITAVAGLATAAKPMKADAEAPAKRECVPTARLYPITKEGKVDKNGMLEFDVIVKPPEEAPSKDKKQ